MTTGLSVAMVPHCSGQGTLLIHALELPVTWIIEDHGMVSGETGTSEKLLVLLVRPLAIFTPHLPSHHEG